MLLDSRLNHFLVCSKIIYKQVLQLIFLALLQKPFSRQDQCSGRMIKMFSWTCKDQLSIASCDLLSHCVHVPILEAGWLFFLFELWGIGQVKVQRTHSIFLGKIHHVLSIVTLERKMKCISKQFYPTPQTIFHWGHAGQTCHHAYNGQQIKWHNDVGCRYLFKVK